ncbi:hypothetical protein [Streptomyces brevispora]|uniref:Uncharacterized protein n=1 Tax=Streptomyces brevispora TaxID=887462 RepID=A0ABZ1GDK6_9ACTN|nr:hypothetical protein [Streptomyces brevispora]WSC17217.1 hypothetical protein OIE64_33285 [Streptomyces brevispora]
MTTRRSGWTHSAEGHILQSFQSKSGGLKYNEVARCGEYRTERLILRVRRMAAAG